MNKKSEKEESGTADYDMSKMLGMEFSDIAAALHNVKMQVCPTAANIVADWLAKNSYDGLFSPTAGCACLIEALSPFDCISHDCHAGYRTDCDCGEGCGFHVVELKTKRG